MKDKSINRVVDNNKKIQKQQKYESNKSKNKTNHINRVNTNFSNDKNSINNSNENKINLKDSLNLLSNDILNNNNNAKKNKNFENLYNNVQKYSNISKVNRKIFNSRDKIMKDCSILNKVKSKNEFCSNNINQKKNFYFNYKEDEDYNYINDKDNIKTIIYKKNNFSKNNYNINNIKNNRDENELDDYIKIEELNEILSSDTEDLNHKSPKDNKRESNSSNTSKLDDKEIMSNTLTIKDELINYDSDNDTTRERNFLQNSINYNNDLALILDKHLTQINFNKNIKNISKKQISKSPPTKQEIEDKKAQMLSLNLNTINQSKDNPFHNNNFIGQKEFPNNSAKINKINKNINRKSHHIIKEKKEIMLINYLKNNFFSKNEENNSSNINSIHKNEKNVSKNDINNCELNEEKNKKNKINNINNINKKSNGIINKNEELKLNNDYDNEEKRNKIKYKEYKIKNYSIVNDLSVLDNDIFNNRISNKNLNKLNQNIKMNDFTNNEKMNDVNNSKENNYITFKKNENLKSYGFMKKKLENNNNNGISLDNEKNYDKKRPKNIYRNNSQNNDIKRNDSLNSFDSNKKENENIKNIYQIKINNLNLNILNATTKSNTNQKINEKNDNNIKIESIEITNKFRKNIPSPQHRNKEKNNIIKKTKISPYNKIINNNNIKLNSSNNLFNTANNPNNNSNNQEYINPNNNENINNNIQININDKERSKCNSNNIIECIIKKNNNFALTCKEKTINEFINKDINMNKLPSKKNIKGINKNINPQKYKSSYKNKQINSMNENSNTNNTNNNCNPSTSTSNNNNNSGIILEDNYMSNNKSPKLNKNNYNFNNSANKYIILNKNKRNNQNINYNNSNEEIIINNSINNYINSNSYSTADKNTFIHITNSNVTKMKNKMNNNNINNQKGINQNYMIHPKNLFSSNNSIKNKMIDNNNNKNNSNKKNDNKSNNTSTNKLNNSNSNSNINIYNDINNNANYNKNNLSKKINSDKKLNIYLYNNINNTDDNNSKIKEHINISQNKSPEIIKKSSTTMKNKDTSNQNNNNNNNINSNIKININNRYSINGNKLHSPSYIISENLCNIKKIENKKICNKISNKVLRKSNYMNHNKNAQNNNNCNEDTFMDGQIPTVADENPNVNSLKIMIYNKCAYTNQIISQKLTKIFCVKNIKNTILSFLSGKDLYNLSLVNIFYNDNITYKIHEKIIKKILYNKEKTVKYLWKELLNKSILYKSHNSIDEIYLDYLNSSDKYDEEITKDLSRTLPNNIMFKKNSNNYKKLFNVLKAYSNYNKKIGYAQGMNFIVAKLIIFYNNEKQSFLNLDALFTKLNFSEVIGISNGLEQKMLVIQFLLKKFCPKIIDFLEQKKINHEIFTVSWVITLFSKNFENNKLLLIIWNFSIIFGWKFIYLFTVSVITNFQNKYLNLDLYEFTQFMKKIFKMPDFEKDFYIIIKKTFEHMQNWKKIKKEIDKNMENYKKTDTESGTEIIADSFDEETIIQ